MGLIKSSQSQSATRDAVVLDLGDLSRQGESIKREAQRRAQQIIAEAEGRREELLRGGREAGFEEGRRAGYEEGLRLGTEKGREEAMSEARAKFASLEQAWLQALGQFEARREELLNNTGDQILEVAALAAERITKRVVELDERVVAAQMEAVLSIVARAGRLSLRVHPADEVIAREALPSLLAKLGQDMHAEIVIDEGVDRGSCIARTPTGGEIDASIKTQLGRVLEVLLPARAGAPGNDERAEDAA